MTTQIERTTPPEGSDLPATPVADFRIRIEGDGLLITVPELHVLARRSSPFTTAKVDAAIRRGAEAFAREVEAALAETGGAYS